MRCRNCTQPIRPVEPAWPNIDAFWVHSSTGAWPCYDENGRMTLDQAEPSDPFAGIDENTESDARRPAVS